MARGYFVAGTDTGVGKTLVSCALLRGFVARGLRAVGMKPVAAGCDDVDRLRAAGNVEAGCAWVNPYALSAPIAPHLAARQAGVQIDLCRIDDAFRQLGAIADVVVVEGVGGALVPLNDREDSSDLMRKLALPVVLVVGMRLGCLNHALLTAEALERRGLAMAGWVANRIDPDMPAWAENIAALEQRLVPPLLGVVPFAAAPVAEEVKVFLCIDRFDG
ncbi:MAG: dethiobiotin synthase [Pseudomonadota bacterium]